MITFLEILKQTFSDAWVFEYGAKQSVQIFHVIYPKTKFIILKYSEKQYTIISFSRNGSIESEVPKKQKQFNYEDCFDDIINFILIESNQHVLNL